MNIYINETKHAELIAAVKKEAKARRRSESYIVREKVLKAYGLKNGGD